MTATFLSQDEIKELTGRTRYRAQLRQLARQGIEAITDAHGHPLVLRAAMEARFRVGAEQPKRRPTEPNWDAMRPGLPSKARRP